MDSLLPETPVHTNLFIKSFDHAMIGFGKLVRFGRLKFRNFDKKWHGAIRIVYNQFDKDIDKAIKHQRQEKRAQYDDLSSDGKTPDQYILPDEMAKQIQNKEHLRSQILAVFMPDRDSIGRALSNVIHVLAQRPEIYQKLREEVLSFQDEPLTFEVLKSMQYTQWVIIEGMCS